MSAGGEVSLWGERLIEAGVLPKNSVRVVL
jgi:hypothetical protein